MNLLDGGISLTQLPVLITAECIHLPTLLQHHWNTQTPRYMYNYSSCFRHDIILSLIYQKSTDNNVHDLVILDIDLSCQFTGVVLSTSYLDGWVVSPAHIQLCGREAAGLGVICLLVC